MKDMKFFLLFVCRVQPESFSWFSSGATGSDVGKANCISSAGGNQTFGAPYYSTFSLRTYVVYCGAMNRERAIERSLW